MPRTNVPVVQSTRDGSLDIVASETNGDDANDHEFSNDGKTLLFIRNSGASQRNVTIITQATADGLAIADQVFTIEAGEHLCCGPFPSGLYNNGSGQVEFDVDHAELKLRAVSLGV